EVCHLDGRELWSRVCEDTGSTQVVDVVSCPQPVLGMVPEAGDGAVDRSFRNVVGPDPEPGCDARAEAFEDDVGVRAQSVGECDLPWEIADHGLAARAKRGVPRCCGRAHRIAFRWLHPDDARTEASELAARIGAGEVAREVDDQRVGQRLHARGAYLYPRRR